MADATAAEEDAFITESILKILKTEDFEIKRSKGKIFVDIYEKPKFFLAVAKIMQATKDNNKWPKNAELRWRQIGAEEPGK